MLAFLLATPADATAQVSSRAPSHADAFWYGRFGYGQIDGDVLYRGLAFAFGRRFERRSVALDVELFGIQFPQFHSSPSPVSYGGSNYTFAFAASVLTAKGLYLVTPNARRTAYVGAGAGASAANFGRGGDEYEDWRGHGIEAQFTAGYALARSPAGTRVFVQADLTRPLYKVVARGRFGQRDLTADRYAPSVAVSLGAGW